MAENTRRFYNSQKTIEMGTATTNLNLGDCIPSQHITGDNSDKSLILQQLQCIPVGDCGAITGDTYQFSCRNFPAFTPMLGQQIKVRFTVANTYGDCQASPATFPKIRIGSLTLPIYAQGKSVGTGFNTANQVFNGCVMGTDIADPSTWWLDLDSNVRQTTSEYTIYSDGTIVYNQTKINDLFTKVRQIYSLSQNKDLNSVTQTGIYVANYDIIADSLINKPHSPEYACYLEVLTTLNGVVYQIFYGIAGLYKRTSTNNGQTWRDWTKFTETNV